MNYLHLYILALTICYALDINKTIIQNASSPSIFKSLQLPLTQSIIQKQQITCTHDTYYGAIDTFVGNINENVSYALNNKYYSNFALFLCLIVLLVIGFNQIHQSVKMVLLLCMVHLISVGNSQSMVVAGVYHTCYLGENQVKCWGRNNYGQLGQGNNIDRGDNANEMGQYLPLTDLANNFIPVVIMAGQSHTCSLSVNNQMKCWGYNVYGGLGYEDTNNIGDSVNEMGSYLPIIELGTSFVPAQIITGGYHSCALSTNKEIKCWGDNYYGQLGQGDGNNRGDGASEMGNYLLSIDLGTNFTPEQIAVGSASDHICALSHNYDIKCWGWNQFGQLGQGDTNNIGDGINEMGDNLLTVEVGNDFVPITIAVGSRHSCAISTVHKIKCWGRNLEGQLGYGDTNNRGDGASEMGNNLAIVDLGSDFNVTQIALGIYHSCALSSSNIVKCWGGNNYGQLGQGHTNNIGDNGNEMGDSLNAIDLGSNFVTVQIYAGWEHTCAVSMDNEVKCWGNNAYGQLGQGDTNNRGDGPNEMGDNLLAIDLAITASPTVATTTVPTTAPTSPTLNPSTSPTHSTLDPTASPTTSPSIAPSTTPSNPPSISPSDAPSTAPSMAPSISPTNTPTNPSSAPSIAPSNSPSNVPSSAPYMNPTVSPTLFPTISPTTAPSLAPSNEPSNAPSITPSISPTNVPTSNPTTAPTMYPSIAPSLAPSFAPTTTPSNNPTIAPSISPTKTPSVSPSTAPSLTPTIAPSDSPTLYPSNIPTNNPIILTTTNTPSNIPTNIPTNNPIIETTDDSNDSNECNISWLIKIRFRLKFLLDPNDTNNNIRYKMKQICKTAFYKTILKSIWKNIFCFDLFDTNLKINEYSQTRRRRRQLLVNSQYEIETLFEYNNELQNEFFKSNNFNKENFKIQFANEICSLAVENGLIDTNYCQNVNTADTMIIDDAIQNNKIKEKNNKNNGMIIVIVIIIICILCVIICIGIIYFYKRKDKAYIDSKIDGDNTSIQIGNTENNGESNDKKGILSETNEVGDNVTMEKDPSIEKNDDL